MNDRLPHPFLEVLHRTPRGYASEWRLHTCPAPECEEPLPDDHEGVAEHLGGHAPEDFGLSPLAGGRGWEPERGPEVLG